VGATRRAARSRFTSGQRLWDFAAMNDTRQLSALTLASPARESQQATAFGPRAHGSAAGPVGALLTMIVGLAIVVVAWRRQQR
jgi:hypothetical protein